MLTHKIKYSKTKVSHHTIKKLNDCIIKIDYFDQTGIKNFEENIPLKHIFNSEIELPLSNV
tara:strand:+ start:10 stop:192 length:183 start_codon:yes stop_codon:yes gene_type:complete